jgi:branched-chain amino acid transport system permease protein
VEIFGVSLPALSSQLLLGLVNGSFYAILSLGLAVIFGLLNIVNFAHGAFFMLGAYVAWAGTAQFHFTYWWSLILAPVAIGFLGICVEALVLRKLYKLDHIYGLLFTFGLALVLEGLFRDQFGVSGQQYAAPALLRGAIDAGFMRMPVYRVWVVLAALIVCLATWYVIDRTKLGSYLRAATENAALLRSFGVNTSALVNLTYGFGVGLAAFAGVLAAPVVQVNPLMGSNVIIVVFAVVVIGGMGSIAGSIVTGMTLGIVEALAKVYYPEASSTVVFAIMALVLLVRPTGLFGRETVTA